MDATREHYEKYEAMAQMIGVSLLIPMLPKKGEIRSFSAQDHKRMGGGLRPNEHPTGFVRRPGEPYSQSEWLALIEQDKHLNQFGYQWDARNEAVNDVLRAKKVPYSWSICYTVCVLKHVAKYHVALLTPPT